MAYLCGFEVGDLGEAQATSGTVAIEGTTVRTGAHSLRVNPTGTAVGFATLKRGSSSAAISTRFYFRYATKPGSNEEEILTLRAASSTDLMSLRLDSAGHINAYDSTSTLLESGTTVLAVDTWYRIELLYESGGGTGVQEKWDLFIDGSSEYGEQDEEIGGFSNTEIRFGKAVNRNSQDIDFFYDSLARSYFKVIKV